MTKNRAAEKHILRTLNGEKGGRAKEKGTRKRSLFCQNFLPAAEDQAAEPRGGQKQNEHDNGHDILH
ncbi:MAG: hypothetical protein KAY77_04510, partial [Oscillospiraceae bacterium]|nr:hypothetical protein [Oscillospiraceae bacterium]